MIENCFWLVWCWDSRVSHSDSYKGHYSTRSNLADWCFHADFNQHLNCSELIRIRMVILRWCFFPSFSLTLLFFLIIVIIILLPVWNWLERITKRKGKEWITDINRMGMGLHPNAGRRKFSSFSNNFFIFIISVPSILWEGSIWFQILFRTILSDFILGFVG